MAENLSRSGPMPMLLVGDIVSIGVKLYELKFKDYLKLSFYGTLWGLLPYAATLVATLFFVTTQRYYSLLGLLMPALIVLFVFSVTKYLAYSALLSRLAFGELTGQPESIEDARRYTNRRKWSFLLAGVLLSLVYIAIILPLYVILAVVFFAMVAAVGGAALLQGGADNITPAAIGSLLVFILLAFTLLLGVLIGLMWLSGRLVSHDLPLAVDSHTSAAQSIGQIWQLTKRSAWRMVLILIIAFCVTLPVQIVSQLLAEIINDRLSAIAPVTSPTYSVLSVLAGVIIGFGFAIILLPFWQVTRSVIYYDLRNRREGIGLQLRDPEQSGDAMRDRPTFARFFKHITISTPESVELEFTLAGIGRRAQALFIDYQFILLMLLAFWILWGLFSLGLLISLSQSTQNYAAAPIWLGAIAILVSFVLYNGYFVFFEVAWQGQTPGKRIAQIRVVRDDGKPIGLAQAVLRSILLIVDTLLYIGMFFILFGKQEKRLGDLAGGTLVVQEQRLLRQSAIIPSQEAEQLVMDLRQQADLSQLTPDDFAIVRAYLQRRSFMDPKARNDLSLTLARQIRALIHLAEIPPNTVSDHFLEAVFLAYQQEGGGE